MAELNLREELNLMVLADLINTIRKKYLFFVGGTLLALLAAIVFNVLTNQQRYVIVASNLPNPPLVSILFRLDLTFNKNLSDEFLKTCQIEFSPSTEFNLKKDQATLQIEPKTRLKQDTTYRVSGRCNYVPLDFTFRTKTNDQLTEEEIGILQTQLDLEFAEELQRIHRENPWRSELPITTEYYELVYSEVENRYLVHLTLPPVNPPTREQLRQEIEVKLREIGAPQLEIFFR